MITICAKCRHFFNKEPDGPRVDVWYNHLCKATEREETIDVVTGKMGYKASNDLGKPYVTDDRYDYCRNVNDGHCPYFQEPLVLVVAEE